MGTLLQRVVIVFLAALLAASSVEARHVHTSNAPCPGCIAMTSRRRFLAGQIGAADVDPAAIADRGRAAVFAEVEIVERASIARVRHAPLAGENVRPILRRCGDWSDAAHCLADSRAPPVS